MNELLKEYNRLLDLHNRAYKYLENNNVPIVDREKQLERYKEITDKLNALLEQIKQQGIFYTQNEVLNGFKGGD